jgi:hypothetical protein
LSTGFEVETLDRETREPSDESSKVEGKRGRRRQPYLRVHCKWWIPILGWYDPANTIFLPLRGNLADVLYRVFELFVGRTEGWSLLQAMRTNPFDRFSGSIGLPSSLDG